MDQTKLKQTFDYFDKDSSGKIDRTEFYTALKKLGFTYSEEYCNTLLKNYDQNGDNKLNFQEFKLFIADLTKGS